MGEHTTRAGDEEFPAAEAAASAFLDDYAAGRDPSTEEYAAGLASEAERDAFRRILRFALTVESFPPGRIRVGQSFGPYRIEEKLDEGGMGSVYRARDTRLPRQVAIKVLPPARAGDETYQKRLELESQVLAQLDHPGIVTVHEAGVVDEVRYLVMDYVDGVPLDRVLARLERPGRTRLTGRDLAAAIGKPVATGRLPLFDDDTAYWTAAARVMREIVRAVEAAHAEGVLHRDLKPANVMLAGGGLPVVLDFGLAGSDRLEVTTVTERLIGSVPYFAPEQVRDLKVGFDVRTDVYQLGLVLYELLVRERAYPQERVSDALDAIRLGRFRRPRRVDPGTPRELEAVCLTAAEPDIERRYASAAALGKDLDRFLAGRPLVGRPPGLGRRAELFARRNRRALGIAAVALLAGGAAGWWVWRGTEEPRGWPVVLRNGTVVDNPSGVRDRDVFAVDLDLPEGATIYALSVTGDRAGERTPEYVHALPPQLAGKDESAALGLSLGPGRHRVLLSRVDAGDARGGRWVEGVWVFCDRGGHPWVRRWIEAIFARQGESTVGAAGVPFDDARRLLPEPVRGRPLKLTQAELAELRRALDHPDPSQPSIWPLADPRPLTFYLPLEGR